MSDQLQKAVRWAVERHAGQAREGEPAIPYATHVLEVMSILRASGCQDEAMLCAAALHDLIEETETSLAEVEQEFGADVRGLIDELTREEPSEEERAGLSKDEIWQLRTRMLLDEIKEISERAQLIKLCDRLSNLREARVTRSGKRLARYVRQTHQILEIVPRSVHPRIWDELKALADEL